MTTARTRQLLGDRVSDLSDSQVQDLINQFFPLAEMLLEKSGFPPGSQFAFKNDRQLMVYEPDSFENIVRAWEAMQEQVRVAA